MAREGVLDFSPRMWEMSAWHEGKMIAMSFSKNGLDWKVLSFDEKGNIVNRQRVFGKSLASKLLIASLPHGRKVRG